MLTPSVYDHPLVRLSSRQSVLTHFALLQLLATAYVPSFTPSSILHHARSVTSYARRALLGSDSDDLSSGQTHDIQVSPTGQVDEWLQSSGPQLIRRRNADPNGWWKLWDVSAECRDIGCMECYGEPLENPLQLLVADFEQRVTMLLSLTSECSLESECGIVAQ